MNNEDETSDWAKKMTEIEFGKGFYEWRLSTESEINKLNQKHKDYFESRKDKIFPDRIDSIQNHYSIQYEAGTNKFFFKEQPENDLKREIMDEAIKIFNDCKRQQP